MTVLHFAAMNGHLQLVKFLVQSYPEKKRYKYDSSHQSVHQSGEGAMHLAAQHGHANVVAFLLQAGFDITTRWGDPLPLPGAFPFEVLSKTKDRSTDKTDSVPMPIHVSRIPHDVDVLGTFHGISICQKQFPHAHNGS